MELENSHKSRTNEFHGENLQYDSYHKGQNLRLEHLRDKKKILWMHLIMRIQHFVGF